MIEFLKVYTIRYEKEMAKLAENFAKIVAPGSCLAFNGNLGAGKTTFIRYFARHFSVPLVNSPTFSLVNVYQGSRVLYHFDFYRLLDSSELFDIGFYEYLDDREAITIIEWAAMFPEVLPKQHIEIQIDVSDLENRKVIFIKHE